MSFYFPNIDPVYLFQRKGTPDNPYVDLEEDEIVSNGFVTLKEIPNFTKKVIVKKPDGTTLKEVTTDTLATNEYRVDYSTGIVYFNSVMNNQKLTFLYRGIGALSFPASRIWIDSNTGSSIMSLQEMITTMDNSVTNINTVIDNANTAAQDVSVAINNANTATTNANTATTNANNAATYANTEGDYAKSKGDEALSASTTANNLNITVQTAEDARVLAETSRVNAENIRVSAEDTRKTNETSRQNAETTRVNNENDRISAEDNRVIAESARVSAENTRETNESSRIAAENTRATNDATWNANETTRQNNESIRETNELGRVTAETNRATAESSRVTEESNRVTAENERKSNELARQDNETLRQSQETSRQTNTQTAIDNANTAASYATTQGDYAKTEGDYAKTEGDYAKQQGDAAKAIVAGTGFISSTEKGQPNGVATLDSNSKIPLSQLPDTSLQQNYVVATMTDRDALTGLKIGDRVIVMDAGDSSREGYIWDGTQFLKDSDTDWANVNLDWTNIINVPNATVSFPGVVQLNDSTSSTSTTEAATSNSVKKTYDLANGKYNKPVGGIPKTDLDTSVQTSLGKADTALPASAYTAADVLNKLKAVDGAGSGVDADTVDGNHASDFYQDGSVIMNTNPFGGKRLFINSINNAMFRAESRFTVTGQILNSDGTVYSTVNCSVLFDGNYDTCLQIPAGKKLVVLINFNGYFPGYPYGYVYLSHFSNYFSASDSMRVYCNYEPHGIGWHSYNFEDFYRNGTSYLILRARENVYNISQMEITINAPDSNDAWITQIDYQLDRPGINEMPILDKFRKNKMYSDIDMNSNKILNLVAPTSDSDATTKKYVDDGLESHKADTTAHVPYAAATGTTNTYAVTLSPAPTAYTDGMAVSVKINADATGASTLNVNSLGAKPIKKANGNDITNLKANGVYTLRYNASTGNFILQGEGGSGTAIASDLLSGKTASTDAGDITGSMPNKVGSGTILTPGTSDIAIPQGYFGGSLADGKVLGEPNLITANIKAGVNLFGIDGKASVVDTEDAITIPASNDSGTYMLSSNYIQISLSYAADSINVTQSEHSLSYTSATPDRYVIDGVTKYFSTEGEYVNNTGFKFWINGWAAANVNWTASKTGTSTTVSPTTADKILRGSIAYANGVKLSGTAPLSASGSKTTEINSGYNMLIVNELGFEPKYIAIVNPNFGAVCVFNADFSKSSYKNSDSTNSMSVGNCYVNSTGFKLIVKNDIANTFTAYWFAMGYGL